MSTLNGGRMVDREDKRGIKGVEVPPPLIILDGPEGGDRELFKPDISDKHSDRDPLVDILPMDTSSKEEPLPPVLSPQQVIRPADEDNDMELMPLQERLVRITGSKPATPSKIGSDLDPDLNGAEIRSTGGGEKRKLEFTADSPFVQDQPCYKYAAVNRCRECRNKKDVVTDHKTSGDIVCRFQSFRKLMTRRNNKTQTLSPHSGQITGFLTMGFCDPEADTLTSDYNLWLPSKEELPERLGLELSKRLITQLGDQFCRLLAEDKEAINLDKNLGVNRNISWKRIVEKVREMCDSCATTIFNHHWACESCGFMVCVECFKARQIDAKKNKGMTIADQEKDEFGWLYCNQNHQVSHTLERMRLIQILPGNASEDVAKTLHAVRRKWRIDQLCGCSDALDTEHNLKECVEKERNVAISPKKIAETVPCIKKSQEKVVNSDSDSDSDSDEENEYFRSSIMSKTATTAAISLKKQILDVSEKTTNGSSIQNGNSTSSRNPYYDRSKIPVKVITIGESELLYPGLPHEWMCFGTLLRLLSPSHEGNYGPFKDLWKRGQPVLVSKVGDELSKTLWTPESFAEHFGKDENDLINCMTGKLIPGEKMQTFWDGFVDVSKRLRDDDGNVMLLKLKDWPPGDDFANLMPNRFADLMKALPLKEYTHRDGKLNLAARLPNKFMAPDLGPKMYIAYGDGNYLDKGTTNLHLDISDAVNCVVYVGVPINCDVEQHNKAVHDAIKDSDCDQKTIKRVLEDGELPGALWHIYRPWDAAKIRDLLNKVSVERGLALEPHHDPIHDQVAYLDRELRTRLREEYDVIGFPIVQCSGDAVFIPAGAPHQVRNLHNCIKIAEDFVSPENVSHCFQLTEEFRNLTDTHTNHEDKLQIKNIVYHAVKDALSVLLQST